MDYIIKVENLEEMQIAGIRFKGSYSETGKYIGLIFKEIKGRAAGAPFSLYYDDEYKEIADIEVCVPTNGLIATKDAKARTLPAVKVISTTHIGKYSTLHHAYKALHDYATANGLKTFTPYREVYIKGPRMIFKRNPDKFVTEVILPVSQSIV